MHTDREWKRELDALIENDWQEMRGGTLFEIRPVDFIEALLKRERGELLKKAKDIVLNSSTEEYTHSAQSYLVANTDKVMYALLELEN